MDNNRRYRCGEDVRSKLNDVSRARSVKRRERRCREAERKRDEDNRDLSSARARASARQREEKEKRRDGGGRGGRVRAGGGDGEREASYVRAGGKEEPEEWIEDVRRPVHHLCRPTGIAAGVPV